MLNVAFDLLIFIYDRNLCVKLVQTSNQIAYVSSAFLLQYMIVLNHYRVIADFVMLAKIESPST